MALNTIICGAVGVQKTIAGIQQAYTDIPSSLNQLPCFVTYPSKGQLEWPRIPMVRTITHDLQMDLYVQKGGDLAAADRLLKPYVDTIISTFDQSITLGGSCLTSGVVDYSYGVLTVAGVEYLGIKFTLKAVEKTQVVYHA
jgi:hypothetical protein